MSGYIVAGLTAAAVVIAAAISALATRHVQKLRTKSDREIERLRGESDREIQRLRGESDREIQRLRAENAALWRVRTATGTLRLQLFLATRSQARRLAMYHRRNPEKQHLRMQHPSRWRVPSANPAPYHRSGLFIYRLLRPLLVSDLIEQEMHFADLDLDPKMLDVLRFNHAAFEMLTGDKLETYANDTAEKLPNFHIDRCWDAPPRSERPFQRVRASYLRSAAWQLATEEPGADVRRRCMTHLEFRTRWEHPNLHREFHSELRPLKHVIDGFTPKTNPIFWLRLVGYSYACAWFFDRLGQTAFTEDIEYTKIFVPTDTDAMLKSAGHDFLTVHAAEYRKRFHQIIEEAL